MTIHRNITTCNRWPGRAGNSVEWIVLHYTANTNQPDLAVNECMLFKDVYYGASAHFFVDDNEVWQSVELYDTAWHCGDNPPSRNGCTNRNSIGIEMCNVYQNGVYSISEKTVARTVELVIWLLDQYPNAKLCRHYDVTGKICPQPWVNNPALWENFKKRVEENKPMTPAERVELNKLKLRVDELEKAAAKLEKDVVKVDKEMVSTKDTIEDLEGRIAVVDERTGVRYRYINEVPEWARPTIKKLLNKKFLKGEDGNLALTYDLVRGFVVNDRAGDYNL